jgi:excisionase family DNA binding protein
MSTTILGTTDAAFRLGCSAERVRQLERAGKLPAEKTLGGQRIFKTEDVERLAAERIEQKQLRKAAKAENRRSVKRGSGIRAQGYGSNS